MVTTSFASLCPFLPEIRADVPFDQWVASGAGPARIGNASSSPSTPLSSTSIMAATGPLCCATSAVNAVTCPLTNQPTTSNYTTLVVTPSLLLSSGSAVASPATARIGFTEPYPYIQFSPYAPPGANVTIAAPTVSPNCTSNCCQEQCCGSSCQAPFPPPLVPPVVPPFPPLPPPLPSCPFSFLCSDAPDDNDKMCEGKPGYSGVSPCDICQPGYFSEGETEEECFPCESGFYCSEEGCEQCIEVIPGHFAANSEGQSVDSAAVSAEACPAGQAQLEPGQVTCNNCSGGYYGTATGALTCQSCPAGNFTADDDLAHVSCSPCNDGSYQPDAGRTQCELCPPGNYSLPDGTAYASCLPCGVGTFGNVSGASSSTQCYLCSVNTYAASPGSSVCQACPSPFVSWSGSGYCYDPYIPDLSCTDDIDFLWTIFSDEADVISDEWTEPDCEPANYDLLSVKDGAEAESVDHSFSLQAISADDRDSSRASLHHFDTLSSKSWGSNAFISFSKWNTAPAQAGLGLLVTQNRLQDFAWNTWVQQTDVPNNGFLNDQCLGISKPQQ